MGGTCPREWWGEPDGTLFEVRGPTYLVDRGKVAGGQPVFHLVAVDVLAFEDPKERSLLLTCSLFWTFSTVRVTFLIHVHTHSPFLSLCLKLTLFDLL